MLVCNTVLYYSVFYFLKLIVLLLHEERVIKINLLGMFHSFNPVCLLCHLCTKPVLSVDIAKSLFIFSPCSSKLNNPISSSLDYLYKNINKSSRFELIYDHYTLLKSISYYFMNNFKLDFLGFNHLR